MQLTSFLVWALKSGLAAQERRRYRPRLELLEDRLAPAIVTVTGTGDTVAVDGLVTLREAILSTNGSGNINADVVGVGSYAVPDTIQFNIPGAGVKTINLVSGLPALMKTVTIAGNSQPGFAGAPLIELNGTGAGGVHGLVMFAASSKVRSLVINRFQGSGIVVLGPSCRVEGCYIGADNTGTAAAANGLWGIVINTTGVRIGGTAAAARNVISGNTLAGVVLAGTGTQSNLVQGNFIGTDVKGNAALGNGDGVQIHNGAKNNTVGGFLPGARNIISGNNSDGVEISAGAKFNKVQGNYIGTDVTGTVALGNGDNGVLIFNGATNNTIGGAPPFLKRNVISGNSSNGVKISDAGTTGNFVQANFIGTNATGTLALGNSGSGVLISVGAASNLVGGTLPGMRNVISGNNFDGVSISGVTGAGGGPNISTPFNKVQGNYIGINAAGTLALGNTFDGVRLEAGDVSSLVGGTVPGARNVISGNLVNGVEFTSLGTDFNVVQGNYIGTNPAGTADRGNGANGVRIANGPANNFVGGTTAGVRNVISGNDSNGVEISSAGFNKVEGNYIGTNAAGSADLGNTLDGVSLQLGAANNALGGPVAGARNVISGNDRSGVFLGDSGTTGNRVQGNFIGLATNGTTAVANTAHGVFLTDQAANNMIGGIAAGAGNTIHNNGGAGVLIGSDASLGLIVPAGSGNSVLGNSIFNNTLDGIDLGPNDGPTANDPGDPDPGPNDLLNKPEFLFNFFIINGGVNLFSFISLNTLPNSVLRIEFFASPSGTQGKTFLNAINVTTGANGNYIFGHTVTFPAGSHILTATATDALGNTSEFSLPLNF